MLYCTLEILSRFEMYIVNFQKSQELCIKSTLFKGTNFKKVELKH